MSSVDSIEINIGTIKLDGSKRHLLATINLTSASGISEPISVFARIEDAEGEAFNLRPPYCGATVDPGEKRAVTLRFSASKAVLPSEGSRMLVAVKGRGLTEPIAKQFVLQRGFWSQVP